MLEREMMYKSDHQENLKYFKDIKYKKQFSLYGSELNGIFGGKTYAKFYKDLFLNKKIQSNNFKKMFEKPIQRNTLRKIEAPFDIKIFNECMEKMEIKQKVYEYKLKHPYLIKYSSYQKIKDLREKNRKNKSKQFTLPDIPDIGQYNPNYEAIKTHAFYPTFARIDFKNFKKHKVGVYAHDPKTNKNELKLGKSYNNKICNRLLKNDSKFLTLETEVNDNKSKMSKYLLTTTFGDEKNNHCLKFDSYSSRKPLINKKMYKTRMFFNSKSNKIISKNLKGVINFSRKTNYGSYFETIAKNKDSPPIGMYKPNYNLVESKARDIILDKKDSFSSKFPTIQKILCSFDVTTDYKLTPRLNIFNTINYELDGVK